MYTLIVYMSMAGVKIKPPFVLTVVDKIGASEFSINEWEN